MHEKGRSYAAKNNILFEETSAKTGSNVKAAFAKLLSRKWLIATLVDLSSG